MRFRATFFLLLCLPLYSSIASADTLKLGIFPYVSAAKLLRIHQPVADYLSQQLQHRVSIASAPGFAQFIQRTRKNKYDIVMTAPHMGALAILQSQYQPLAVSTNQSHAVFLVRKSSTIQSLKDIHHSTITMPPQKAIISKLALQTLQQYGQNPEQMDIEFTRSHNNAFESVLNGDADMAVIGLPTWKRATQQDKNRLRVVATSQNIPGFMLLANPQMETKLVHKIASALQNFHRTPAGQAYFKQSKLQQFRAITQQDIEELKPYVAAIFRFKP